MEEEGKRNKEKRTSFNSSKFLASNVRDMSIAPRSYVITRIETKARRSALYINTTDDPATMYSQRNLSLYFFSKCFIKENFPQKTDDLCGMRPIILPQSSTHHRFTKPPHFNPESECSHIFQSVCIRPQDYIA